MLHQAGRVSRLPNAPAVAREWWKGKSEELMKELLEKVLPRLAGASRRR